MVASATALVNPVLMSSGTAGAMGTNPYLLSTMLDGKLSNKQQIPLVMAVGGSKSPALPFLLTEELDDDELEFAMNSKIFTGYPGSTGATQRILPFLSGDYADQDENVLPLMMLASKNPVGHNIADVVDNLVENKAVINEKDYYLFDQLYGGKPAYTENPLLARNMFKKGRDDKFFSTRDFLYRTMENGQGMPSNTYITKQMLKDHKQGGTKAFVTGDMFSYTRGISRGDNDVFDFMDGKDFVTGKDIKMMESMKPAEDFNLLAFNMFKNKREIDNQDLKKLYLTQDEFNMWDYNALDDKDNNRLSTPSEYFRYTGVTGKDAGKFFRDTLGGAPGDITMHDYIQLQTLRGDDIDPIIEEALFDSDDVLSEKNLFKMNQLNGEATTDFIEIYEAMDASEDDAMSKVDMKVYNAYRGGLPAGEGVMWDVLNDGPITEVDLVELTALSGKEVPLLVEELFDSSDDEVTNEDLMIIESLSGGTVSPFLLSNVNKGKKVLTPEDYISYASFNGGVSTGVAEGFLDDLLDDGVMTYDQLKLPLLLAQSSDPFNGGEATLGDDLIPAAMSLMPKVDVQDVVYPWAMTSGNYDPYLIDNQVTSGQMLPWLAGGNFNAPPAREPVPEPEPEPVPIMRRPTVAAAEPVRVFRPNAIYGSRVLGQPLRVGPYGLPLRTVGSN